MFSPLPKETVLEAKANARRNTFFLFCILTFIYLVAFNLLAFLGAFFFLNRWRASDFESNNLPAIASSTLVQHWPIGLATCLVAFMCSVLHFWYARSQETKDILNRLGAVNVDEKDKKQKIFKDIVEEAESAINVRPIQAAVVKTTALNAFSISDLYGNCAIGVTQGLLDKLDRSELSAVIAHEASHLANQDSNLTAIAYSVYAVFNALDEMIFSDSDGDKNHVWFGSRARRNLAIIIFLLLVKLISEAGKFLAALLMMAISRNREYLADSQAVAMCKDPLSMAEALYKIARTDRGGARLGGGFNALFILNPEMSMLDEKEDFVSDLFSTHPPVRRRMGHLLNWAREDVDTLMKQVDSKMRPIDDQDTKLYMARQKTEWVGPMTPEEMIRLRVASPQSWIMNNGLLNRAASVDKFKEAFNLALEPNASIFACARCKTLLSHQDYENVKILKCAHCEGYLLLERELTKIILSHDRKFGEEDIKKTLESNARQKGTVSALCHLEPIFCPFCKNSMNKKIYNQFARVAVDQCSNTNCAAIWFDAGELERYQIILEENMKKFQSPL